MVAPIITFVFAIAFAALAYMSTTVDKQLDKVPEFQPSSASTDMDDSDDFDLDEDE